MGQDRVVIAIARIERALARIEAAAGRPSPASMDGDSGASELRAAHLALRGRVEGAIAQIDGLLASGEQG
jgi:hypothetical protein